MKHYITLNNKKYSYTLQKIDEEATFIECEAARIKQEFPNEEIPALLQDLPDLILEEKEYQFKQNEIIRFRVSTAEKKQIEKSALKNGYVSVSSFLRELALGSR